MEENKAHIQYVVIAFKNIAMSSRHEVDDKRYNKNQKSLSYMRRGPLLLARYKPLYNLSKPEFVAASFPRDFDSQSLFKLHCVLRSVVGVPSPWTR